MTAFQKRHSVWVYISMAGLVLTGLMINKHSAEFKALNKQLFFINVALAIFVLLTSGFIAALV